MYAGLHEEIWVGILKHLGRPRPKANNGACRADLMQPDWATCMTVSSTFNRLTSPLLYCHVITDRLDQLLEGVEGKAASRKVASKRDLSKRVKSLDLEYPDPYQDLPYHLLLQGGGKGAAWNLIGMPPNLVVSGKLTMWLSGYIKQFKRLDRLARSHPGTWDLDSLTYNAYLPVHDHEWDRGLHYAGWNHALQEQSALRAGLRGTLQAYNKEYRPGKNGAPTVVMHQQVFQTRIYGSARKMRWVYETPMSGWRKPVQEAVEDALDDIMLLPDLADHMETSLWSTPDDEDMEKANRMSKNPPQIDFYISRPVPPVTPSLTGSAASVAIRQRQARIDHQKKDLVKRGKEIEIKLKESDAFVCNKMKVSLGGVEDAPACRACGA